MDDEQLSNTIPQLKWFLFASLVPWPLFLFHKELDAPTVGLFAVIAIFATPVISLLFSVPAAKFAQKSIVLTILLTLSIPFAYLIIGIRLVRAGTRRALAQEVEL